MKRMRMLAGLLALMSLVAFLLNGVRYALGDLEAPDDPPAEK